MTAPETGTEELADRIAAHGREALLERLRQAYADAAATHADIISLAPERIEAMARTAVERADGLQWRRALADVAATELGIDLVQALAHPAVTRAQQLLGAPAYEASLAELVARPVPPSLPYVDVPSKAFEAEATDEPATTTDEPATTTDEPAANDEPMPGPQMDHLETVEADDELVDLLPAPEPIEYGTDLDPRAQGSSVGAPTEVLESPSTVAAAPFAAPQVDATGIEALADLPEPEAEVPTNGIVGGYMGAPTQPHEIEQPLMDGPGHDAEHTDYPPPADQELRVTAYHLGGVANLPSGRNSLDLRLSEYGLDILEPAGEIIGRLHWNEIDKLEVSAARSRLRRQARGGSKILVRTKQGDASFEIPELTSEQLQERVTPLLTRFAAGAQ